MKLEEDKKIGSMDYVCLIDPNEATASLGSKDGQGQWAEQRIHGLDGKIQMLALGIALKMDAIHEGIDFPAAPCLATGSGEAESLSANPHKQRRRPRDGSASLVSLLRRA